MTPVSNTVTLVEERHSAANKPYQIVLTADERRTLEDRARRYTLPYRDVVRAKIVLLAAEGLRNDENRRPPGYPPRDRLQVAQALLPPAAGRVG